MVQLGHFGNHKLKIILNGFLQRENYYSIILNTKIMEKINNKKAVYIYIRALIVLMVSFILMVGILVTMKPIPSYLSFSLACVMVCVFVFYFFIKMKTFEFENSVFYISIKQSYFWKLNPVIPPIEFPNDVLTDFNVRKGMFSTSLILFLSSKGRTKKLHCDITGLNDNQITELKQSLQNAIEHHEI